MKKMVISFDQPEGVISLTLVEARSVLNHGSERKLIVVFDERDNNYSVYSSYDDFFIVLAKELS